MASWPAGQPSNVDSHIQSRQSNMLDYSTDGEHY